jgi:putative hydrolase of the HAD superfamily
VCSSDLTLAVISNFDRRLYTVLDELGLSPFFDAVIISSEVGASKPHRRIFEAAMNMAGARPEQCLHIGDDASADVAGAEALGIRALHVRRPETTLRDLLKG